VLYAILKPLTLLAARLLFRLEARGIEHVPPRGPVLLVANHASVLDPPLVGCVTPRPVHFLAKAELFRIPLLGDLIRRLNARPVRRDGADPAALRIALRVLGEEDAVLLVFPEGTRGEEGVLRQPKPGAGMLAVMSGAPVVPVLVRGSGRALPRGAWLPRPRKVTVTFGPPLAIPEVDGRKARYGATSEAMMAAIANLQHGSELSMKTETPTLLRISGRQAAGGAGVSAGSGPPNSTHGRTHGEG
jgi:1-acyl-sn-glycerol-3-phosphate acyltransferase